MFIKYCNYALTPRREYGKNKRSGRNSNSKFVKMKTMGIEKYI